MVLKKLRIPGKREGSSEFKEVIFWLGLVGLSASPLEVKKFSVQSQKSSFTLGLCVPG